jgi:hypothetical protein
MEVMTPPPSQDFMHDNTAATTGAYPPGPAVTNPFSSADDMAEGNPLLAMAALTAPPSPNPFEHLPPGASDADPFDLFQHFTSAPVSPARAAAIYAQFDTADGGGHGNADDDDVGLFQTRVSYSTVTSTVPFEWEEKPGKPKSEFAVVTAADDADFDFGVLLDKAAKAQELTTADELFDEGKIRPLKPPPRLLDGGGSVGSSPRSARSAIWSPRLRGTRGRSAVGSGGADFDPFAAALEKAAMAPSPLGIGSKLDNAYGGVNEPASSPMNPNPATSATSTPPDENNGERKKKKWRLSDLLLFRRVSSTKSRAAGNISRDPVFNYSPVQQLGMQFKDETADQSSVAANGDASSAVKHKRQNKKATASTAADGGTPTRHKQSMIGCVRLHPGLHRLAKGFNGHSVHLGGRGNAKSAMKG